MTDFTIETTYHLPVYRHGTYTADTLSDACRLAMEDEDWSGGKQDHECCGPTYVTGIWPGAGTAHEVDSLAIPPGFTLTGLEPLHTAPARPGRFVVGIAFLSDGVAFAEEEFTVTAPRIDLAEGVALQLARSRSYHDERIPKLGCALTLSAQLVGRAGDSLLEAASEALSGCLDDLDARSASSPESCTQGEIERRERYATILDTISEQCSLPPLRVPHPRFDRAWSPPFYGTPIEGPMRSYAVLVTIYLGEEIFVEEIYQIDALSEIQAEHLAIDRSDYSPHWRDSLEDISRSARATEVLPRVPATGQ